MYELKKQFNEAKPKHLNAEMIISDEYWNIRLNLLPGDQDEIFPLFLKFGAMSEETAKEFCEEYKSKPEF